MNDTDVQEAEVVAEEVAEEPIAEESTELAVRAESTLSLPTPSEWQSIEYAANTLSRAGMVPAAYRGRPADIIAAILTGRELGWGPMSALQRVHVIDGKPGLSAEAMVGLVRREKHTITAVETNAERVIVRGTRRDNGDELTVEWTIEMAQRVKFKNGTLANKDNWKNHPESMLWARAVSTLCKRLFPDVLMGYTYTPDELGERVVDVEVVEDEIELPAALQEMRGTWSEQEIEDAANALRDALEPPLQPIKFIALAKSSPEALAKVKAKLESTAERSGDEWSEESAGSDGAAVPAASEPKGDEAGAVDSPSPQTTSIQNACPECGFSCYPNDSGRVQWKCSNCDFESFHNDPWKPGGQVEQILTIKKLPQEMQDLIEHLKNAKGAEVCQWITDLTLAEVEDWRQAELYGKNRKLVMAGLRARLDDQEPEGASSKKTDVGEASGLTSSGSEPHQEGLGVDVPPSKREPK